MDKYSSLVELCKTYNSENESGHIEIEKYSTAEELIVCLWKREVEIGDLGFGEPYDETLKSLAIDEDDETGEPIYDLERNMVYKSLTRTSEIKTFLLNHLNLPDQGYSKATAYEGLNDFEDYYGLTGNIRGPGISNIDIFNHIWTKMGKDAIINYAELKAVLNSDELTSLQLAYLFLECDGSMIVCEEPGVFEVLDIPI
jgi:hypothetical protein